MVVVSTSFFTDVSAGVGDSIQLATGQATQGNPFTAIVSSIFFVEGPPLREAEETEEEGGAAEASASSRHANQKNKSSSSSSSSCTGKEGGAEENNNCAVRVSLLASVGPHEFTVASAIFDKESGPLTSEKEMRTTKAKKRAREEEEGEKDEEEEVVREAVRLRVPLIFRGNEKSNSRNLPPALPGVYPVRQMRVEARCVSLQEESTSDKPRSDDDDGNEEEKAEKRHNAKSKQTNVPRGLPRGKLYDGRRNFFVRLVGKQETVLTREQVQLLTHSRSSSPSLKRGNGKIKYINNK